MRAIEQCVSKTSYTIAAQVKYFREYRKLTQAELGKLLGMKQSAIARLEATPDIRWTATTLLKIAGILDVRVSTDIVPNK